MRDQKRKQIAADTSAPTDTIDYDAAVREGKEIVLEIEAAERGQLRLGELADNLEPKYGDRTLSKYATEIDVAKCTLDRYRTVWRAWKANLAPGPNSISPPPYAVCRELAAHPEFIEQIIRENPNISKREARNKMRNLLHDKKEKAEVAQEEDWGKHNRRWFQEICTLANDALRAALVVIAEDKKEAATPEQLRRLAKVVDPHLLPTVRNAGKALVKLADYLDELVEEPQQERRSAKAQETVRAAAA